MILLTAHIAINAISQGAVDNPASFVTALFFAALTAAGMLTGVWIVRRFESWAIQHTGELIAFAAGLLVSGALLHLISRSVELVGAGNGLGWAVGGFLGFYLLEAHFIPHVHARGESPIDDHAHDHDHHTLGPMVVIGLGVHSIVDGVSVGAGLSAGTIIGSVALILVVVHKLPVGIAAMSALYHSGVPGHRAAWITATLASVTPIAVLISYFAFRDVTESTLGILLGLAGGSFLYVGAADLLPEGQARGRVTNTSMFLFGAILMALIKLAAH